MECKTTPIVAQPSNTQRVIVSQDDNKIMIQKEWRRTSKDTWRPSKAITIPQENICNLINILVSIEKEKII